MVHNTAICPECGNEATSDVCSECGHDFATAEWQKDGEYRWTIEQPDGRISLVVAMEYTEGEPPRPSGYTEAVEFLSEEDKRTIRKNWEKAVEDEESQSLVPYVVLLQTSGEIWDVLGFGEKAVRTASTLEGAEQKAQEFMEEYPDFGSITERESE